MEEIVIDASNLVSGRLASTAAKEALKGRRVFIVNAENALVSGDKKFVTDFFSSKIKKGDPYHGPFYPKTPEGIVKRMVRGMLPYKKNKGMEALKRVKVYRVIPDEFKSREMKDLSIKNRLDCKHIKLGELCKRFGSK